MTEVDIMRRVFLFLLAIAAGGLITGLVAGGLITGWADVEAVARSIGIGLLYTAVMTVVCVWAGRVMRGRVPLDSPRAVTYHVLAQTAAIVVSFAAATALSLWIFQPDFSIESGTLGIVALVAVAAALAGNAIVYTALFFRRARQAERAALEAELSALRAQINPHFLFNALNTIAALTRQRPETAEAVTQNLADLFRYSLQTSKQPVVTLEDELESARLYLSIEKERFKERLQARFEVPEEVLAVAMPSLILQPLVENAVKHGVSRVLEPCTITVAAERMGERVLISVTDTGPGFETNDLDAVTARGTGLANVRERLRLYSRADAGLDLIERGVRIWLPHRTVSDGRAPEEGSPASRAASSSPPEQTPHPSP